MAFYRLVGLQVPKVSLITIDGPIDSKTGKINFKGDVVRIIRIAIRPAIVGVV